MSAVVRLRGSRNLFNALDVLGYIGMPTKPDTQVMGEPARRYLEPSGLAAAPWT